MNKKQRKHVVVTNQTFGVYFGEIESEPDNKGRLKIYNMRHCFSWVCADETKGVWGLALTGPQKGSKIGPTLPEFNLLNVSGWSECTPAAIKVWLKAKWD